MRNWENQTIWTRDNLEVLRRLNSGSVDLIYLDPPFNSNRNYEAPVGSDAEGSGFRDTWTWTDIDRQYFERVRAEDSDEWLIIKHAARCHSPSMASYLIVMAPRLKEMKRILKDTGSIYLHCDPTASHYLKGLMDMIFGVKNFRNEIVWCYQLYAKGFKANNQYCLPRNKDYILHYAFGDSKIVEKPTKIVDLEKDPLHFSKDSRGYYSTKPYNEGQNPVLKDNEKLYETKSGRKRIKRYVENPYKMPLGDTWVDILDMTYHKKEYVDYPTQKPLALLRRIIKASSNPGDIVLDPFCGCATACVAAEKLGREWVGIDTNEVTVKLANLRLPQDCIHRTDLPHRTDLAHLPRAITVSN